MSTQLFPCLLCNVSCEDDYITIEKNITGEETIFLDICVVCFEEAADELLKDHVYEAKKSYKCLYCKNNIENDMGDIIMGNKNASGKYCAIMFRPWRYVFMHPECYEENIGI